MIKQIFAFTCIACFFAACSLAPSFGKKITINDNLEIFIKGDSTTEADAKKLGTYLAETWKDLTNKKSFQLSKDKNVYIVKMVVDEAKVKADSSLDVSFMAIRTLIADEVFKGSKVILVITNNEFKDIKTYDDKPIATIPKSDSTATK